MSEEPTTQSGCFWLFLMLIFAFPASLFLGTTTTMEGPINIGVLHLEFAPAVAGADETALDTTVEVLKERLIAMSIVDATVTRDGDTFIVEIPAGSVSDMSSFVQTLTTTGLLEFVDFSGVTVDGSIESFIVRTTEQDKRGLSFENAIVHPVTNEPFITVLTGDEIQSAAAEEDQFGSWMVQVEFTAEGSEIMGAYTESHLGEPLAIVLDGRVLSAPVIQTRLETTAVIQGNFTQAEAQALAVQITSGALPIPLTLTVVE